MFIQTLKIKNFQGIEGTTEFQFDKVNAFCQAPGAGKTSVLNAIRYGLTGTEPEGETINRGKPLAAVELITNNGNSIIREKLSSGANVCFVDKQKSGVRRADEAVESHAGTGIKAMKIASSADVLKNMKPQDLGTFLLGYAGEELTADQVIGFLPDSANEVVRARARKALPDGEFGISAVRDAYKKFVDERREIKRSITGNAAVIENLRKQPVPTKTKDQLLQEEANVVKKQAEAEAYTKLLKQYEEAKTAADKRDKVIAEIERQLKDNTAKERPAAECAEYEKNLAEKRKALDEAKAAGNSIFITARNLKKMIEGLNTTVCPLSAKLVCTTDKTTVKDELEKNIKEAEEGFEHQKVVVGTLNKDIADLEKKIKDFNDEKARYEKKVALTKELERVRAQEIKVPEKPAKSEIGDIARILTDVRNGLRAWEDREKAIKMETELEKMKNDLATLDLLVSYFDPKGCVMSGVTQDYLKAFGEMVNEKANQLIPGMRMKFISDNGVKVLLDVHGDDKYLGYESLSGGERALYLYLMLYLVNTLTGLRILILDELSVLDAKTLDALVKLVLSDTDDYDQCFIAAVNHSDIEDVFKNNGVKVINI